MAGNSQKFARIKLGIKLISDSVGANEAMDVMNFINEYTELSFNSVRLDL